MQQLPSSLELPFSSGQISKAILANGWKTPFHLYSEEVIRKASRKLHDAFLSNGLVFKNHFAVKACPNPHIMEILADETMGMDCSSVPELMLSRMVGVNGEDIMFTSNNTSIDEFAEALANNVIVNLDDITHIQKLESVGMPDIVCCRFNPGDLKEGNAIIGKPTEAKYGMRRDQIIQAYRILKEKGVKRFWLHAMMVSNERTEEALIETSRILFELAHEIYLKTGVTFEFINLGGGIGVPYRPEDHEVDVQAFADGVARNYREIILKNWLGEPRIFMENGRYITGPAAALITRVTNVAEKYRTYVGMDSSMQNLMRPGIYGAYHHITPIGKENLPYDQTVCVTGSLCENNDQFAIQRQLPKLEEGDALAIHTTGAHGHAMGFNYNGKLRCAELLLRINGTVELIRRAETPTDLFRTLDCSSFCKTPRSLPRATLYSSKSFKRHAF